MSAGPCAGPFSTPVARVLRRPEARIAATARMAKFTAPRHVASIAALSIRFTDRLIATAALPDVRSSTPALAPSQRELKDRQSDGEIAYRREPIGPLPRRVCARRADQNADAEG